MTAMTALLPAAALLAAATVLPPHTADAARATDVPTAPYVVVLKDTSSRAPARALAAEAAEAGDQVSAVYDTALNGFAVRTTAARAAELAADPRVASVEPDGLYRISDDPTPPPPSAPAVPAPTPTPTPTPAAAAPAPAAPAAAVQRSAPWPLDRIDQRELPLDGSYTYASQGRGVTVYVVDTGINTLHQEFGGRARAGYNAVFLEGASDCNGHGTHVAAAVGGATYGVAKGVSLVGVKVADCRGDGRLSAILRGLDWMVKDAVKNAPKGPLVANMSMGGSRSHAMDAAVIRAVASGITFTVAAGNEGKDACAGSPSGVPQALTVGATDAADRRPAFSNHGPCVDISAPGVSVVSAWKGSATALARASGTSMAAPHVAGVAALILSDTGNGTTGTGGTGGAPAAPGTVGLPGVTGMHPSPEQVRQALVRAAVPDRITNLPAGTPNLLLHVPTDR
ncbi:S8 family peptidase [Streptomyces sp. NBC_01276]|uniref:S8 family peptidase n=1 Tax=Streptomyces sp. NBC_01276 TaxID=2903808 RepID=UPI00352F133A